LRGVGRLHQSVRVVLAEGVDETGDRSDLGSKE
jgi:hypothetical protein